MACVSIAKLDLSKRREDWKGFHPSKGISGVSMVKSLIRYAAQPFMFGVAQRNAAPVACKVMLTSGSLALN